MNREQHAFIKLAEEAGEVAKEALKIAQFGLSGTETVGGKTNLSKLSAELNDLFGALRLVSIETGFVFEEDSIAVNSKVEKVLKYRKISEELGLVNKVSN